VVRANAGATLIASITTIRATTVSNAAMRLDTPLALLLVIVFLLPLRCVLYLSLACPAGALCSLFVWLSHLLSCGASFAFTDPTLLGAC
jgi:hypothetical protein